MSPSTPISRASTWATTTSATTGSSYTLRFSGTRVALYGAKAPHLGQASVQIDGGTAVTIDQYAPTRQDNVLIYQSPVLSLGTHSVKITVEGTHQAASTGQRHRDRPRYRDRITRRVPVVR